MSKRIQAINFQSIRLMCWKRLSVGITGFAIMLIAAHADQQVSPAEAGDTYDPSIEDMDPEFAEWSILEQKAEAEEITPEEDERRRWLGGRLMDKLLKASLGRFLIEGEVVDESGNRLHGVMLRISKEKERGIDQWVEDKEEKDINGTFGVSARGYEVIRLFFSKDGYYDEKLTFSTSSLRKDPLMRRGDTEESVVEHRNIRVVLEKKGDITNLIEYSSSITGPLTFKMVDGVPSGAVLSFDREMWEKRRKGAGHLRLTAVTNLLDLDSLPPHCIYILAETDDDGRVATENKAGPNWPRPYHLPENLKIRTSDPAGGFIVYEQDDSGDEHAFWSMKRAPENGYEQELILDADWLFRRSRVNAKRGPEAGIYLYFKVNEMYGKGRIENVEMTGGLYELKVSGVLRLQMDGTRNVDTGRQ